MGENLKPFEVEDVGETGGGEESEEHIHGHLHIGGWHLVLADGHNGEEAHTDDGEQVVRDQLVGPCARGGCAV